MQKKKKKNEESPYRGGKKESPIELMTQSKVTLLYTVQITIIIITPIFFNNT
jgi:hypothetical protein